MAELYIEYSAKTTVTPNVFTFSFGVSSSVKLSKIVVKYSGQTATGTPVAGSQTYTPQATTFSSSFTVNNGLSATKSGSAQITSTDIAGHTETRGVSWTGNISSSGQSVGDAYGQYLTVWGSASKSTIVKGAGGIVTLYGYGNTNHAVKTATFKWNGKDAKGNAISGSQTINNINKEDASVSVTTKCSADYSGSATVTMSNGYLSKSDTFTWSANSGSTGGSSTPAPTPQSDTIKITNLTVDKANSTGLVDGKFVEGSKLRILATISSTQKTKTARFVLSGAKQLDTTINTYGSNTVTVDTVATASGTLKIRCIATDEKGNTADRTINVTIEGSIEKDLYGFYFFKSTLYDALKNNNVSAVVIKLYNSFDEDDSQVDPAGLTYNLYGHTFTSYSNCKNNKDMTDQLTWIKTFVVPSKKKEPYIEITLTASEINELKKYKGIAFGLVSEGKLTIHNKQCYVDVTYK